VTPSQEDLFANPLERARELKARHRYDEALRVLLQARAGAPADLRLKASLADLHYRTGNFRQALTLAGEILEADPNDPRALVVMGNVLLVRKKPADALGYFRLALEVAETEYLWSRIARCQLALRTPREALAAVERAEALGRGRETLRLKLLVAHALRDPALEARAIAQLLEAAPPDPEGFAELLLPALHDLPARKAVALAERLRGAPGQAQNPDLLLFEVRGLLRARDPEAAARRLPTLLSASPPDRLARQIRALEARLPKNR
jgi:tetratricopeptide (TPR) repeat protein